MKGSSKMAENSYSVFIPEIWSAKLNTMLEKDCVMLQCVNRNYEGEIKNQGDKVKIITLQQCQLQQVCYSCKDNQTPCLP